MKPPFTLDINAGLIVDRRALIKSGIMNRQIKAAIAFYNQRKEQTMSENRHPTALELYQRFTEGCEPTTPIERLRAFCSFAMSSQDWIDVEPFFAEVARENERLCSIVEMRNVGFDGDLTIETFGPINDQETT